MQQQYKPCVTCVKHWIHRERKTKNISEQKCCLQPIVFNCVCVFKAGSQQYNHCRSKYSYNADSQYSIYTGRNVQAADHHCKYICVWTSPSSFSIGACLFASGSSYWRHKVSTTARQLKFSQSGQKWQPPSLYQYRFTLKCLLVDFKPIIWYQY